MYLEPQLATLYAGEPVFAWCGPQPNSRLLLNYGIVDEQNPNDKMTVTATIPNSDPLFAQKRQLLQQHNMASQQNFQLQRHQVSHYCHSYCSTSQAQHSAARHGTAQRSTA